MSDMAIFQWRLECDKKEIQKTFNKVTYPWMDILQESWERVTQQDGEPGLPDDLIGVYDWILDRPTGCSTCTGWCTGRGMGGTAAGTWSRQPAGRRFRFWRSFAERLEQSESRGRDWVQLAWDCSSPMHVGREAKGARTTRAHPSRRHREKEKSKSAKSKSGKSSSRERQRISAKGQPAPKKKKLTETGRRRRTDFH